MKTYTKESLIEKDSAKKHFSPKQLPQDPGNMIMVGQISTRIEYNDLTSQWILKDAEYDVTAVSEATKVSYLLGKHSWTISNDFLGD